MRRAPVLAYHIVFGAYGFWLPNDPRGSWSTRVGSPSLLRFGEATKTSVRRSVAHRRHDHEQRLAAKRALKHDPVQLSGVQARAVGGGIAAAAEESEYVVHACAILLDHVHPVVARHDRDVRRIATQLKARATQRLKHEQLWPAAERPVWARGGWVVFLFTREDILRTIRYVEENPLREKKPRQRWSFVRPFE